MKYINLLIGIIVVFFLSGCMYPQSELSKNQIPNETQLNQVQEAVIKYKEQTNGLVPIKTKPSDVDMYEQYLIDFTTLKETQLLQETPSSAYENGGVYQYILLTPEENPQVKLIDLRMTDKLREVNVKLNIYRSENLYPPFGEKIADGIFTINYKKLGLKSEPYVVSPFSKQNLPFVMTTDGDVYIDYRIDLQLALEEFDYDPTENEDLRTILTDNYPFVPAYSLPYVLENDEPVFDY